MHKDRNRDPAAIYEDLVAVLEARQECPVHVLRGLKDSIWNEPDRTWNKEMHA